MVAPSGKRAVERCRILGVPPYSDMEDGLYRGYLSPAHAAAVNTMAEWMREAGMQVELDSAANLTGRYDAEEPGRKTLLIASHIDTVRNGGCFDGPLGIMLGIECVARLHAAGKRMPYAIEVIAFGDEEGSRFPNAMLCSRALVGTVVNEAMDIAAPDGTCIGDALFRFAEQTSLPLPPGGFDAARRSPTDLFGYFEIHIEQGPVLEAENLALGAVSGIAAQLRYEFRIAGEAGHAGTSAMHLRHDALAGAAEIILTVEQLAQAGEIDEVATVGRADVLPGAANVVPGFVRMYLDVRAGDGRRRDALAERILKAARDICEERRLNLEIDKLQDLDASPCDPYLTERLEDALEQTGHPRRTLVSGAGHDAMIISQLCPTAMLFIRCERGISHNPAENVDPADADEALDAMTRFLEILEERADG